VMKSLSSTYLLLLKSFIAFCRLERDSKLSALEERADALQDGSAQFEKRAASLKNKFWLENLKSMIAMGFVGLILLLIIYFKFIKEDNPYPPGYNPYMAQGNMHMGVQTHPSQGESSAADEGKE